MHLSAPILLRICTQLQCGIWDVNISCHNAGVMHIHLHPPVQLFTCRIMLTSPLSLSNLAHAQVVDGVPLVDLRPTATNPAFAGDKAVGVKKRRASRVQGRQRDRSRYARTVHAHARDLCVQTCMLTYCIASCSNPPPSPTAALTLSSTVEDFDLEEDPTFLALSVADVAYAVHIAVQNIEYLFGSNNLAQVQCIICVCVRLYVYVCMCL